MGSGELDPLSVLLKLKSTLAEQIKEESTKITGSLNTIGSKVDVLYQKFNKYSAAGAIISGAFLAVEKSAQASNINLAKTATLMDLNERAVRDVALENKNLKSSIESTSYVMMELARNGVKDTSVLLEQTNAVKQLAKATGTSAEQMANELLPAMRAAGVPMNELAGAQKNLIAIWAKGGSLSEFTTFLQRNGYEARQNGVDFNRLTAIYAKFVAEGIPARKATQMIGEALDEVSGYAEKAAENQKKYTEALKELRTETASAEKISRDYTKAMQELTDAAKEQRDELDRSFIESMENQRRAVDEARRQVGEYSKAIREAADNSEEVAEAQEDLDEALRAVADAEDEARQITDEYRESLIGLAKATADATAELATGFQDSVVDMSTSLDDTAESIAKYRDLLLEAGVSEDEIKASTDAYTAALATANAEREESTRITEAYKDAMAAAAGDSAKQTQLTRDYEAAMDEQQNQLIAAINAADEYKDKIIAAYTTAESEKYASIQAELDAEEEALSQLKDLYREAEDDQKESIDTQIKEKEKQIAALQGEVRPPSGEEAAMEEYMEALARHDKLQQDIKTSTDEYRDSLQRLIDEATLKAADATDTYNEKLGEQNEKIADAKKVAADSLSTLADAVDTTLEVAEATAAYEKALADLDVVQAESAKLQEAYNRDVLALQNEVIKSQKDMTEDFIDSSSKQGEAVEEAEAKVSELFDLVNKQPRTLEEILNVGDLSGLEKAGTLVNDLADDAERYKMFADVGQEAMTRLGVAGGPVFAALDGIGTVGLAIFGGNTIANGAINLARAIGLIAPAAAPAALEMGGAALAAEGLGAGFAGAAAQGTAAAEAMVGGDFAATLAAAGSMSAGVLAGAIVSGIGLGMAGVWGLVQTGVLEGLSGLGKQMQEKFSTEFDLIKIPLAPIAMMGIAITDTVTGQFDQIPVAWTNIWTETIRAGTSTLTKMVKFGWDTMNSVKGGMDSGKDLIIKSFESTLAIPQTLLYAMTTAGTTIMQNIRQGVLNGQDLVKGAYTQVLAIGDTLLSSFLQSGRDIPEYLVKGIKETGSIVYDALIDILGPLGDLLPHSPAKAGPLSQPVNWDSYIVDPFAVALANFNKYKTSFLSDLAEMQTGAVSLLSAVSTTADAVSGLISQSKKEYYDLEGNYIEPVQEKGPVSPLGYVDMGGYANDFNISDLSRKANSAWETGTEIWDATVAAWRITYTNGVIRWFADLADDAQAIKEDLGSNIPARWQEAIEARGLETGGLVPATVSGEVSPEAGYQYEPLGTLADTIAQEGTKTDTSNELLGKIVEALQTLITQGGMKSQIDVVLSSGGVMKTNGTSIDFSTLQKELQSRGVI